MDTIWNEWYINSSNLNICNRKLGNIIFQLGDDKCKIACYIPINPLDISSDWKCTICDHTIGPRKIHELEEAAEKIISSGMYSYFVTGTKISNFCCRNHYWTQSAKYKYLKARL